MKTPRRFTRSQNRWRVLGWPLVALLLTPFGTAHAQTRDHDKELRLETDTCREEKVPLTVRGAISLVTIEVNGKLMTFIVDSAGVSMINSERVSLRVVKHLNLGPVTVSETAPLESWNVVEIGSLKLGHEQLRNVQMLSRQLPHLEKELGSEVDGILGADMLTRWDAVSLDYKHGTMRLGRAKCSEEQDERLPRVPRSFAFRKP